MITINILPCSKISIEFLRRNTIPAHRWFVLSSTPSLTSCQYRLGHVLVISYIPWHSWNCSFVLLVTFRFNLAWNTMLMLPRSMTVVRRTTTRTLEVHCQMFLALLSKHRCIDNIMNSLAPLSKWWCTCWSNMYIMLYFSLGKDTLLNLVFKHIFLSIGLLNLSCDLYML